MNYQRPFLHIEQYEWTANGEETVCFKLQTNGLFSSSSWSLTFCSWILISWLVDGFESLACEFEEDLWVGLLSGKSFNVIPMPISKSPVPCCSVNGFVKIMYDNSNVTAFLAVVTCPNMKKIQWKIWKLLNPRIHTSIHTSNLIRVRKINTKQFKNV